MGRTPGRRPVSAAAQPGDTVTMRVEVHTADGTHVHAFPVVVSAAANGAGMLRVWADDEHARRFGRWHWLAEADAERWTDGGR